MALNPVTVYPVNPSYVAQPLNTYSDMADVLNYLIGIGYTGNISASANGWELWFQSAAQNTSWNATIGDWIIVKNNSIASSVQAAQAGSLYTTTPPA